MTVRAPAYSPIRYLDLESRQDQESDYEKLSTQSQICLGSRLDETLIRPTDDWRQLTQPPAGRLLGPAPSLPDGKYAEHSNTAAVRRFRK